MLCIQDTKLSYRKFRALFLQELVDNLQLGTEKRHTSSWTVSRTLWVYQTGTFTNSKWLIHHFSVCSWGTPWKLAAETGSQAAKHLKEQIYLTSPVPVNGQIYARTDRKYMTVLLSNWLQLYQWILLYILTSKIMHGNQKKAEEKLTYQTHSAELK